MVWDGDSIKALPLILDTSKWTKFSDSISLSWPTPRSKSWRLNQASFWRVEDSRAESLPLQGRSKLHCLDSICQNWSFQWVNPELLTQWNFYCQEWVPHGPLMASPISLLPHFLLPRLCGVISGRCKVRPKVIHFWWRACRNLLATKENLDKCKCGHSPAAPLCLSEGKSVEHYYSSQVQNV